jgi:dolichol-phosphate mannosyltransferase
MWTFRDRGSKGWARRYLKYHLTILLGATVNYVVLLLLTALGLPYLVANIAGIVLSYLANYLRSRASCEVQ